MNQPALASDTDGLSNKTGPDAERRGNGVRFSEIGISHILNFYPDLACLFQDGKIAHLNHSGAMLLGLRREAEAHGWRMSDLLVPEFSDVADEIVAQMLSGHEPFSARMRTGMRSGRKSGPGQAVSVKMTAQWAREIGGGAFVLTAQDITHRLELLEEIKRSEEKFRHLVDNALDLVCAVENGRITFVNKTGLHMLHASSAAELIGRNVAELCSADYRQIFSDALAELSREEGLMPAKALRLDTIPFDAHVTVSRLAHLGPDFFVIQARDISEHRRAVMALHSANLDLEVRVRSRTRDLEDEVERRRNAEKKLRDMANHDSLTGLPNRGHLLEVLKMEIDAAAENPRMMAVMYVDLDGFKAVNDGRGHNAGDMLLKIVAQRLKGCIRKSDLAARIGGDEFVVVLRNVKTLAIVATRARDIVAMMGEPFDVDGDRSAEIGASVGVALFPDDGATPDSLLKAADGAMYGVKQGGKNAVAFAS
ncbi:MAG: diguanylate cyclase [Rhodospirillales bacterium]